MNILVLTKRVAAAQEEELRIKDDGKTVDLSKLPFKVNDWQKLARLLFLEFLTSS